MAEQGPPRRLPEGIVTAYHFRCACGKSGSYVGLGVVRFSAECAGEFKTCTSCLKLKCRDCLAELADDEIRCCEAVTWLCNRCAPSSVTCCGCGKRMCAGHRSQCGICRANTCWDCNKGQGGSLVCRRCVAIVYEVMSMPDPPVAPPSPQELADAMAWVASVADGGHPGAAGAAPLPDP